MKKLAVSVVAVLVAIGTVMAVTDRAGAASPSATTNPPTQPDVIDLTLTYHPSGSTPAKTVTLSALSYSFDAAVKTGAGSGKRVLSPIVVTIAQGSESPTLAGLLNDDKVIPSAKLAVSSGEAARAGFETEALFLFKNAVITGIRSSGKQEAVNSDVINSADAQQVLTIDYQSVTQSYYAPPPVN